MHSRFVLACLVGTMVLGTGSAQALQCVPYARDASGISLRGDAWTWWSEAAGQYERGQAPVPGAVVVFKKHGSMHHGHVAVVKKVVSSREVLVDHANWGSRKTGGRGRIATNMAVIDVSEHNTWTKVRVWNRSSDDYGTRIYPTYGFIYPENPRVGHVQMARRASDEVLARDDGTLAMAEAVTPSLDQEVEDSFTPLAPPAAKSAKTVKPSRAEAATRKETAKPTAHREARMAETTSKPAAVPAPVMTPAPTHVSVSDVIWEDDAAMARRFGSGHY